MTRLYVTEHDMFVLVVKSSGWLGIGGLTGAFHYLTLQWNAQMLATGSSASVVAAVQLIRLVIIVGVLTIITRQYGAVRLLFAILGVLASRAAVLRLGAPP